jgi:Flp pilus assembly secretin CpaC
MYRILITPLNGDRAYWYRGGALHGSLQFETDARASDAAAAIRDRFPDARVEVIYKRRNKRA